MGCANSSAAGNKTAPAKLSPFDARVAKNLERLKVEYDASKNKVTSFDQIILKFPKINASFTKVKAMFHKRRLTEDQNLFVREGDFIKYGEIFYEIVKLSEPKLLFGQAEHRFEVQAECIRSRDGLFNAE